MKLSPSPTKAQAITIDFITGLVIIITALVITTNFLMTNQKTSTFDDIKKTALTTTELLMSTGYPPLWNQTNIVNIGLITDNKLNNTKLAMAANMSYAELKTALHNPPNVYWYYENKTNILNLSQCGYGDPTILATTNNNCTPTIQKEKNLIKLDRFITNNNTIIRMVVIVWD